LPKVDDETARLSWEAEIAYETCLDLIGEVIGVYAAKLWTAEHASPIDDAAIADLRRSMAHYATLRQQLRPEDADEVSRLTRECADIVRAGRD
jgi:hypothetical protein